MLRAICVAAAALALLAGALGAIFLFCFQEEETAMFSLTKPRRQALAAAVLALAAADSAAAPKPGGGGIADPKKVQVPIQMVFSIKLEWASGSGLTKGYKVAYTESPGTPSL